MAYADGALSPLARTKVDAFLLSDPEGRRRVESFVKPAHLLQRFTGVRWRSRFRVSQRVRFELSDRGGKSQGAATKKKAREDGWKGSGRGRAILL